MGDAGLQAGMLDGSPPSRVIAVVGDSHAQNLYHAIAPMLPPDTGIALVLKGGCPLNLDGSDLWLGTSRGKDWCGGWTRDALAQLKDLHPDEILILSYSRSTWTDEASAEQGFRATWSQATQIAPVTVVRDFPKIEGSGPQCLAVHAGDPSACSYGRDEALKWDLAFATATKPGSGVQTLDLTSAFCDETRCYPVVGGLPVYYDNDHITGTFARSLAPLMASKLR